MGKARARPWALPWWAPQSRAKKWALGKGKAWGLLRARARENPSMGKAMERLTVLTWWAPKLKGRARALPWALT